jgi:hypothetical protein
VSKGGEDHHHQERLRAARQGIGHDLGTVAGDARKPNPPATAHALAEMADIAVFMASDKASGMTGTTVNLTMGSLND